MVRWDIAVFADIISSFGRVTEPKLTQTLKDQL